MSVPTYLPYVVLTGNALTLAAIFYGLNRALAEASWPRPERLRALTVSATILLGWLVIAFGPAPVSITSRRMASRPCNMDCSCRS